MKNVKTINMSTQIFFKSQRAAQKAADNLFYETPDSLWVVGNEITDDGNTVWFIENLNDTQIHTTHARLRTKNV